MLDSGAAKVDTKVEVASHIIGAGHITANVLRDTELAVESYSIESVQKVLSVFETGGNPLDERSIMSESYLQPCLQEFEDFDQMYGRIQREREYLE